MNYHEATTKLGNMIRPSRQLDNCRAYILTFNTGMWMQGHRIILLPVRSISQKVSTFSEKSTKRKGDNQLAIQNTEKFLDLWKDADKDLPDLIDAKKRLAKLKEMSNKGS